MAFTTEFVMGAGGGVEVQSQPVSWNTRSGSTGERLVATINLGNVGNWRVVFVGTETSHDRSSNHAEVVVNGTNIGRLGSGINSNSGFSVVITGDSQVAVSVIKNIALNSGSSIWSGTAFWWPVD